jgi:hypothetical protein
VILSDGKQTILLGHFDPCSSIISFGLIANIYPR